MPNPPPSPPDPKLLTDLKAARLLERASELDLARTAGTRIAELRAAAAEAGISHESFDAALAELDAEGNAPAPPPPPRSSPWKRVTLIGGLTGVILAGSAALLFATYLFPNAVSRLDLPMEEETIALTCIAPSDAAGLARPILFLPENTIVVSPEHAPRVLKIVATQEQIRQVKAKLAEHDVAGSASCSVPPAR